MRMHYHVCACTFTTSTSSVAPPALALLLVHTDSQPLLAPLRSPRVPRLFRLGPCACPLWPGPSRRLAPCCCARVLSCQRASLFASLALAPSRVQTASSLSPFAPSALPRLLLQTAFPLLASLRSPRDFRLGLCACPLWPGPPRRLASCCCARVSPSQPRPRRGRPTRSPCRPVLALQTLLRPFCRPPARTRTGTVPVLCLPDTLHPRSSAPAG